MGETTLEIMKLYIDGAKSFVRLSSAGLVLPVILKSKIIGLFEKTARFNSFQLTFVCISWACFLLSIGAGVFYQYAAVKFLEYKADPNSTYVPGALKWLVKGEGPGVAYGVMLVAFYGGAVAFVVYSLAAILP